MNELVERLRNTYGNLTPGAIERADLDGMAFTVQDAITALEAAERMASATCDQEYLAAVEAYHTATQKKD